MFGAYAGIYFLYKLYFERKKEQLSLKQAFLLKSSAFYPFIPEILLSGFLFLAIAILFYTNPFRNYISPISIMEMAFSHWMEMHRIQRLGGLFYFYVPILLLYEIQILFFGILGIIYFLRQRDKNAAFFLFLSYWAVASLLLYSYLQEKVPWLVVHIVLPFAILAGTYLGDFFSKVIDTRQTDTRQTEQISEAENGQTESRQTKNGQTEQISGAGKEDSESGKKSAFKIDRSRVHTLIAGILALTLIISYFSAFP